MARESSLSSRVYFLDNLRMFTVLAVVALHAGIAYATVVPAYYVMDQSKNVVFDILLLVTDGFTMPVLYFIAGYFAIRSLKRHGPSGFLVGRLWRLGLPLVVITILFCPIISYVAAISRGASLSYIAFWLSLLPSLWHWHVGGAVMSAESFKHLDVFIPYHLWFLGLLLVFDLLLLAGQALMGRRLLAGNRTSRTGAGFGLFCLLALIVGVAEALAQATIPDLTWTWCGPFCLFQPSRLPLYIGFFGLGVFAWSRDWFATVRIPGRTWLWAVLTLVTFLAMMGLIGLAMAPGVPKSPWIPFAQGLARTLFCLAVTGLLAVFGQRCWNRPGKVSASLSASSYDIYLAHYPLVIGLQYLLTGVAASALTKFGIVFPTATLVCWGASRFADGRRRAWVPAGTLVAFGLCLLAWG